MTCSFQEVIRAFALGGWGKVGQFVYFKILGIACKQALRMGYSEIYFRIATFRKQITHTESLFAGYSWYSVTDNSICLNLIEDFRHLQLKVDPLHRLDTGHSWRYTITLNVTAFFWHKTFNKRALQNAFYFCVKSSSQTSLTLFSDVVLKLSRLFQVDPLTGNCATSTETLILH